VPDEKRKENCHQVKQLVLVRSLVLIALQFGANGKAKQVVLVEAFCRLANSLVVGTLQSVLFRRITSNWPGSGLCASATERQSGPHSPTEHGPDINFQAIGFRTLIFPN